MLYLCVTLDSNFLDSYPQVLKKEHLWSKISHVLVKSKQIVIKTAFIVCFVCLLFVLILKKGLQVQVLEAATKRGVSKNIG